MQRQAGTVGIGLVAATPPWARHGDPADALRSFHDAISRWHHSANWTRQWPTLRNLAELFVRLGRDRAAAVLAVTSPRIDEPAFGRDAEQLARGRRRLQDRLGDDGAAILAGLGAAMGGEEIVAFARRQIDRALGTT